MRSKVFNVVSILMLVAILFSFGVRKTERVTKSNAYKVIRVNGSIVFVKTGTNLKTGDAYVQGTPLAFATNRDRAAVVNKIKGRYILQPNPKGKAIILPATSNIAPRSSTGNTLLNILDVQNYFSDTCVFIGDVNITFGKEAFPFDKERFLYVTYVFKDEIIAKKLLHDGQEIMLSEDLLFEIDGERIPTFETKMTLYSMKGDKATSICSFYPVFPDQDVLKKEVAVLLAELEDLSVDKKLEEVGTYIGEFYGKPQKENLNDWLYNNFSLGKEKEINFK